MTPRHCSTRFALLSYALACRHPRLGRQQRDGPAANPGPATAGADDRHAAQLRRAHGRHEKSGRAGYRRRQQSCRRPHRSANHSAKTAGRLRPRTSTNSPARYNRSTTRSTNSRPASPKSASNSKTCSPRSKAGRRKPPSNKRSSRLSLPARRPMSSITTPCAITTAPRTISPFRNFPTTSSSTPTPISPEIATSISAKFNSARETTSKPPRATTRSCRIFPPETKPLPLS
jgi:hypothetical protein